MRYLFILFLSCYSCMLTAQDSLQHKGANNQAFIKVDKTFANGLGYSIYLPVTQKKYPLVVFINGVGNDVRGWNQYKHWPKAVVESGMAAIVYEASAEQAYENTKALMDSILQGKTDKRIDHNNIVLWMCSSNAGAGVRLLMDNSYPQVKGASLYYPSLPETTAFRTDVKIELVKAGLDSYSLNKGIDDWLLSALQHDVDITFINFPAGRHAFDMYDDELPQTSHIIGGTLQFMHDLAFNKTKVSAPAYTVQRLINLMEADKTEEAKLYYAAAIKAAPDDGVNKFFNGFFRSSGLLAMAEHFKQLNKPAMALLSLTWALEREPQHPENHLVISKMYEEMGDTANAKWHAGKARELMPGFGHPNKTYLSTLKEKIEQQWEKFK